MSLPCRRQLHHTPPSWVPTGSPFFVTICAVDRRSAPLLAQNVPNGLFAAARRYHEIGRWNCELILIMPDHLHAVISVPATEALAEVVTRWKGFTSRRLAIGWQRGFFDHRLRSAAEHELKLGYIRLNPVRAGLVAASADWPWQWQPDPTQPRMPQSD